MSIGPLGGILGSAAGAPLSQTQGSESERTRSDNATQARQADADKKAEQTAGVGQTQEDQATSDRDADGRRLWEAPEEKSKDDQEEQAVADSEAPTPKKSKDPTGASGSSLDLLG